MSDYHPMFREIEVRKQPRVEITYACVVLPEPNMNLVISQVMDVTSNDFIVTKWHYGEWDDVKSFRTLDEAYAGAHEWFKEEIFAQHERELERAKWEASYVEEMAGT